MKTFMLSIITTVLISGGVLAENFDFHQEVTFAEVKPLILFQMGEMNLIQYSSEEGLVLYRIENFDEDTITEDLNRNDLVAKSPEMEEKIEG
mgnify:CR=1 FL=1